MIPDGFSRLENLVNLSRVLSCT